MRRLLILLHLLLFLALSTSLVYARPLAQSGGVEAVVTSRAKLRAGPGTDWAILGVVEAGQPFRIDGRAPYETLWVRGITIDGRIGWIFGDLISAPIDQLNALPTVWVDDPFSLTPPAAAPAPSENTSPAAAPISSNVISGITSTARRIFQAGQALGNRANIFSKVGDSITVSPYFLFPIGWGTYNLRGHSSLQRVVNFFRAGDAREGNNSFANPSLAAYNGITTSGILDPNNAWAQVCQAGETPLECEYRIVRPSVALIMLGTNDVVSLSPDDYRSNLSRIVQITVDRGIIPVLSLIPTRTGYESSIPTFNLIIADVARSFDTPLWNYPAALSGLDNAGLGDGIHPSAPPGSAGDYSPAADFTADNLRYGYTVRNLTALQVLDAVWRRAMY
jgi:lysophospholipase L1-like esterase